MSFRSSIAAARTACGRHANRARRPLVKPAWLFALFGVLAWGSACADAAQPGTRDGATTVWPGSAYLAAVGAVTADGDALQLRGAPKVEQAVAVFAPVSIDADAARYLRIRHDGLAPQHELSLFFRAADGEHTVDLPVTTGDATVSLDAVEGWRGTIVELALVYGPAGNIPSLVADDTLTVHRLAFEPESSAARARAAWTEAARIRDWRGTSNHVLPYNAAVLAGGALAALALAAAVLLRGRARRGAAVGFALAFVLVQAVVWRQWLVLRDGAERVSNDRRAAGEPLELDWQLVAVADALKAALADARDRVGFVLRFEDPYTTERLRWHLVPFHARRGDDATLLASDRCALVLSDRVDAADAVWSVETAFSPVVLTLADGMKPACRSLSLPRSR